MDNTGKAGRSPSGRTRPIPILVVDDNEANLMAFEAVLQGSDYRVHLANSGMAALQKARVEDFAVILLDVRMPGMDGYETAALLRQHKRTRATPIIFLSAYDRTPELVAKGYKAGATDYLFSPVNEDVLRLKVAAFVDLHLRHQAVLDGVADMKRIIAALQAEVEANAPEQQALRTRILELEERVESLELALLDIAPEESTSR